MIKQTTTVQEVVELLNDLTKRDREGMETLVNTRVSVEAPIADHSTVQVMVHKADDGRTLYLIGALGLLNGLFGVDESTGMGAIAAVFGVQCPKCGSDDNDGRVVGDNCSDCGEALVLGKLQGFALTNVAPLVFDDDDIEDIWAMEDDNGGDDLYLLTCRDRGLIGGDTISIVSIGDYDGNYTVVNVSPATDGFVRITLRLL